ncbi:alpha/beta hydrolase [Gemmata sp. JC717]|uniref:alpha/beta hydrolase fold domain-containing protein n=1 Tax=Gemmata algarum TaxID=2975278 RepID=UPI0021BAD326|nr:alpha/beta hydrolase [Gemmata algarum]MDY3555852.1 alpha/beta hydrolase [Gemmata algarum]
MARLRSVLAAGLLVLTATLPALPARGDGPAPAAPGGAAPLAVKTEKDVVYDTIDKQELKLDICAPKEGGSYPCIVLLHGGAWIGGSRKDLSVGPKGGASLIEEVAAKGYVVASVGYRLAPKHRFPAQIQDVRAAVRFLRANAKTYGIDRDKFAAAGFSAGGHLALLLGLADKVAGWDAGSNLDQSSKVQCVVDFFGPTDLSLYNTEAILDGYLVPVFGKDAKTDKDVFKKASPVTYASKAAPPVLIFHGTFDVVVPVVHSESLHKKLTDCGASCQLVTLFGEGHGWTGRTFAKSLTQALTFLDTHLKGKEQK